MVYSITQNHKSRPLGAFHQNLSSHNYAVPRISPFPRPVSAHESPSRLSLTSMFVSHSFIRSLHANYCNQTQVFIILHLTYLLTARLPMLSPAADFAEQRPPHHTHQQWNTPEPGDGWVWSAVGQCIVGQVPHGNGNSSFTCFFRLHWIIPWFWSTSEVVAMVLGGLLALVVFQT